MDRGSIEIRRGVDGAQTVSDLARLLRQLRRREARRRDGTQLTYRELAAKTGWSRGIIGEYLSGRILPPTDRFDVLIRLLGAEPAEQGALATVRDRVEERRRAQSFARLPIPHQIPTEVAGFIGRVPQIAELDRLLGDVTQAPLARVVILSGTAGVGKTALAVHWAHRVAHRFPDGQLYVNLRGFDPAGPATHPAEALRGFLLAQQVPAGQIPDGMTARSDLFRSLLAGRRVLVVLDNAHDAGQVRPLLPGAPDCLVVITSRNALSGMVAIEDARRITLDLLTAAESRALLATRLGAGRVAAEPDPVHEITERCARLPLALAIVAARATAHREFPLTVLASQLREAHGLEAFDDDDSAGNVRSVFSWSYQRLSPRAAALFRLLGLHCGPDIAAPAMASLAAVPPAQVRMLIDELTRVHLITEHTPGRYTFHDLLRAYAAELTRSRENEAGRRSALHRLLDHYLHTAYAAATLLYPYRDRITLTAPRAGTAPQTLTDHGQARAWFLAEQPVLLGLIDLAARVGFDRHVWQLAWTLVDFLMWQGNWRDWAATQRAALVAAVWLGDRSAQAAAHRGLARPYLRMGRHAEARAHLDHATELFEQLHDGVGLAHVHFVLGWLSELNGRYRDALGHDQRCLDLFRAQRHRVGEAIALNNLGWHHTQLGDFRQGLAHCQEALALLQKIGDRHGMANTWDSIGLAHHHLGQHEDAAASYQRAAKLFGELGDRDSQAGTLTRLGDTQHAAGQIDAARRTWRRALAVLDELRRPGADAVRARLAAGQPG